MEFESAGQQCWLVTASSSALGAQLLPNTCSLLPRTSCTQRFILHPDYYNSQADPDAASPRLVNDIALVLLDAPVEGVPLQQLADNSTVGVV